MLSFCTLISLKMTLTICLSKTHEELSCSCVISTKFHSNFTEIKICISAPEKNASIFAKFIPIIVPFIERYYSENNKRYTTTAFRIMMLQKITILSELFHNSGLIWKCIGSSSKPLRKITFKQHTVT